MMSGPVPAANVEGVIPVVKDIENTQQPSNNQNQVQMQGEDKNANALL